MRMYDVIKKKRDGAELSTEEINAFVVGYTKGEIPDYQAAALMMAIYFKGMTLKETVDLTLAVANSGDRLDLSAVKGFKVDKHSTGGVGDKTTLIVAPIVASLGVKVAKMSGRGLGHTGGTIDKLESIPGFRTNIEKKEFENIVNTTGMAVVGQTASLAPADKKLYALRDVTATVDSMPLIASSIMGKKLAAADDGIVLDVKVGSGSFMKTIEQARKLAQIMVHIGNSAGKRTIALLTDMDKPLGRAVGNSLEVIEAIRCLNGNAEPDLFNLCIELSAAMLRVAGFGDIDKCRALARAQLNNGGAFSAFRTMVRAQGGNLDYIDNPDKFVLGNKRKVTAQNTGYISTMNTESIGLASLVLGAGRAKKEDSIDSSAGLEILKKCGDWVNEGDTLAILYSTADRGIAQAEQLIHSSIVYSSQKPQQVPLIMDIIE